MGAFIVTIKMHFVEKKMMLISFSGRPLLGPNVVKMSKIAMWALIAIYISSVAWLLKSDNLQYNTLGRWVDRLIDHFVFLDVPFLVLMS